ncbi:CII family transcriptional regulator [Pseudomonas aeruginosa]|uniref:CII family transcriptional regulator n=1 Tax=Pseudomonas aeruginosa TaxID=287 RepID=UPI001FFB7D65|nr:CII family transcriptional regulator [Pseudomonas aeruginosa]
MTASQLNPERDARAREFESLILNRLLSVGQKTVADTIGVSESTVSRWKEGEIERWCKVLALLSFRSSRCRLSAIHLSTSRRSRPWPSLAFRPKRSGLVRWGGIDAKATHEYRLRRNG